MLRRFLPVGQGAFYCESFFNASDELNIVYDCGSETRGHVIDVIDQEFSQKRIKAVFISHLHYDHVNGLDHLLKNTIVDRVYFPEMTDAEKTISLLDLLINQRDADVSFIQDLHIDLPRTIRATSESTEIIPIPKSTNEPTVIINATTPRTNISDLEKDWVFIPFNLDHKTNILDKINEKLLRANEAAITTPEELSKCYTTQKIKDIIDAVYKDELGKKHYNEFSMTLYSGPRTIHEDDKYHCKKICPLRHPGPYCYMHTRCCCCNTSKTGCLYTGDYNALQYTKDLYKFYN